MAERDYEIGSAEFEVLTILWNEGSSTVRDVRAHLREQGRDLAYTTVQTLLTRLEQKRFVKSDKSGLAFVFKATLSRDRVRKSRVRHLVSQLYDGAAAPLVLQLIRNERFSAEEVGELQKLIEELDTDKKRPKP